VDNTKEKLLRRAKEGQKGKRNGEPRVNQRKDRRKKTQGEEGERAGEDIKPIDPGKDLSKKRKRIDLLGGRNPSQGLSRAPPHGAAQYGGTIRPRYFMASRGRDWVLKRRDMGIFIVIGSKFRYIKGRKKKVGDSRGGLLSHWVQDQVFEKIIPGGRGRKSQCAPERSEEKFICPLGN